LLYPVHNDSAILLVAVANRVVVGNILIGGRRHCLETSVEARNRTGMLVETSRISGSCGNDGTGTVEESGSGANASGGPLRGALERNPAISVDATEGLVDNNQVGFTNIKMSMHPSNFISFARHM
jgi:hypothetical protein